MSNRKSGGSGFGPIVQEAFAVNEDADQSHEAKIN
jgi:hypothetical protein